MLARIGEKGTRVHCWWDCIHTLVQPLWKKVPWTIKSRITILTCSSTSGYFSGEKKKKWKQKCLLRFSACGFSSVAQSCLTLCDPIDCSTPGFPVHHQLLELTQTHVYQVGDAIQPSHPLSAHSPPGFNLSQHKGLYQGVSSLHHVAKVLAFQLQHQSFQFIFRTGFL